MTSIWKPNTLTHLTWYFYCHLQLFLQYVENLNALSNPNSQLHSHWMDGNGIHYFLTQERVDLLVGSLRRVRHRLSSWSEWRSSTELPKSNVSIWANGSYEVLLHGYAQVNDSATRVFILEDRFHGHGEYSLQCIWLWEMKLVQFDPFIRVLLVHGSILWVVDMWLVVYSFSCEY